jgi:hypothetical protein
MGRTEAVEYRRFRVIETWKLQDDLAAGWPFIPFVHMSGLHAADMHKIDLEEELWPQKCVGVLPPVDTEITTVLKFRKRRFSAALREQWQSDLQVRFTD